MQCRHGAGLTIFSLISLAPYILFLDAPVRGAVMVCDDSCCFRSRRLSLFMRLDWLHALRVVPSSDAAELGRLCIPREDADRTLQLVRAGERSQGFRAVVDVLELTPIAILWAPLLRLPGIAWIGNLVYRRVAARRSCRARAVVVRPGRRSAGSSLRRRWCGAAPPSSRDPRRYPRRTAHDRSSPILMRFGL